MQSPTFTRSSPKRADVTGQPDQVFDVPSFIPYIIKGIENGTIATIGTINIGSSSFQYLFSPRLHKSINGECISIVGNTLDDIGDCGLCEIKLAFVKAFVIADERANFDKTLTLGEDISPAFLANTA